MISYAGRQILPRRNKLFFTTAIALAIPYQYIESYRGNYKRYFRRSSIDLVCIFKQLSMNLAIAATMIYGLLAGIGGIFGYVKSKSKPSLISGCISGILLLLAAWMQIQGNSLGLLISQVIISLLVVVFIVRLIKTKKFMPAGIMTFAGVAALICLFAK